MKAVKQQLTGFVSTNLQAPHAAWSSATTYAQGDYVLYNDYHYMSVVDGNLNVTPDENTGKWLLWEVSNKFACLDLQSKTETVCNASTISSGTIYDLALTVNVNGLDTLAFGAVKGDTLTIVEKNVSNVTVATTVKNISNGELDYAHVLDASANTAEITVTELTGDDFSSIGSLIGGVATSLGETVYNPKFGFSTEITKTEDPSGIIEITKKSQEETIDVDIAFDATDAVRIKRELKTLEGVISCFIIDESTTSIYENMFMLGYMDDFTIAISNPSKTFASISIQEVV